MLKTGFKILILLLFCTPALSKEINLQPIFKKSQASFEALEKIKKIKILVVRGSIKSNPHWSGKKMIELLTNKDFKENIDFEIVQTASSESPLFAASDVVKAIRDSQKPVLIWSSHKASADVLEALIRYPRLQKKVKGFISIQGTLGGVKSYGNIKKPISVETSVIAAKMPLIQAFRFLVDYLWSFKESYSESQYSLKPQVRKIYLDKNDAKILQLSKNVPSLFVGHQGSQKYTVIKHNPYLLVNSSEPLNSAQDVFILKILASFLILHGEI